MRSGVSCAVLGATVAFLARRASGGYPLPRTQQARSAMRHWMEEHHSQQTSSLVYTPTGDLFNPALFEQWVIANAPHRQLAVAPGRYTIPNATGNVHFPLLAPLQDVVLDFSGVTLRMGVRTATAVQVSNWQRVALLGLTIEYAQLPTNQAVITGFNPSGTAVSVNIPKGYPLEDWQSGIGLSCNVYGAGEHWVSVGTSDMTASNVTAVVSAGPRQFQLHYPRNVGPSAQTIAVGDTLGCRNAKFAFTFHVDGCASSLFANLTVKGGPGFGFFHGHPSSSTGVVNPANVGGNVFSGLRLTYPDRPVGATENPVLSASADGFHANGVPRGLIIENSLIEGHNDDGIALHGQFSVIVDVARLSDIAARIWVTRADYGIGDTVRVFDPAFSPAGDLIVTSVAPASPNGKYAPPINVSKMMPSVSLAPEPQQWYTVLEVSGPLPPVGRLGRDTVLFDQNRSCSGFILRNNTIRNHRARGMLIKASDGVIADNHIENSTLGGIIITPELSWGEGSYVSNLSITDNVVRSVCTGKQCYGGLALAAIAPTHTFAGGAPHGHTNVQILRNRFENISQMQLWVTSADNVAVKDNVFVGPYAYPVVATCCPPYPFPTSPHRYMVWASQATNLSMSGDCVVGPAPAVSGVLSIGATSSVTPQPPATLPQCPPSAIL